VDDCDADDADVVVEDEKRVRTPPEDLSIV